MSKNRCVITATGSGSGKTLITCGLMGLLKKKGYQVAGFKCGPDYIDPMFHGWILGERSTNLDSFFLEEEQLNELLSRKLQNKDIGIIEGVMGYYDGIAGKTTYASTYEVAQKTKSPTILIVNCKGKSVSALAEIFGFCKFREDANIKGVILNRVSPMMYPMMKKAIENELSVKVIGYLPKLENVHLESRYLGLLLPHEIENLEEQLEELVAAMEESIDIEALMSISELAEKPKALPSKLEEPKRVKIGVAKDDAFCFIYPENIRTLEEQGAEIIYFSPIKDMHLPKVDGLIFYGGYPENFGKELSENTTMLEDVRTVLKQGIPVLAECGGFMYLHTEMEAIDGKTYPLVGHVDGRVYKTNRLSQFGYISLKGSGFLEEFKDARAHEFHYYASTAVAEDFVAQKPCSNRNWKGVISGKNQLIGFPHLYYPATMNLVKGFINRAEEYQKSH